MSFDLALKRMQAVSFANYCSVRLGRPQRRLCRQILYLSV